MDTPWFLQHLGLTAQADAREIKRAYAARLKLTDQQADLEGFTRLRQAYEMALRRHQQSASTTATEAPAPMQNTTSSTSPDSDEVAAVRAPSRHASEAPAQTQTTAAVYPATRERRVAPAPPPLPAADPAAAGRAILQRVATQIRAGKSADVALAEACLALQQGHVQLPMIFECMLVDSLATASLRTPLLLFLAARQVFAWSDIRHLQLLGPRGQWVQAVSVEESAWRAHVAEWRGSQWFEYLELSEPRPALTDALINQWPRVAQHVQRFPNYLRLKLEPSLLEQWHAKFAALPALERDLAQTYSFGSSPAAFNKAVRRKRRSGSAGSLFVIILGILLGGQMLVGMIVGNDRTSHPYPATAGPQPSAETVSQDPRLNGYTQTCAGIEQLIHSPHWTPPADRAIRQHLRNSVNLCLARKTWPHWQMADSRLQQLGIHT